MPVNVASTLRLALRTARRQPAFTAVIVATLAVGIGANTAMFATIHAALLKPLPYENPDRLVLAWRTVAGETRLWNSAPDFYDYRDQIGGFQSLAAAFAGARHVTVKGTGRPERIATTIVTHDLFSTLGVKPVAGRWFEASEATAAAPYVVMISERLAERKFGGAGRALGQSLAIAGIAASEVSAAIVGVIPASYRFLHQAEMWVPMRRGEGDGPQTRQFHNWVLVGRLKADLSRATVQEQADVVAGRLQQAYPATNKEKALRLDPLQSALFQSRTPTLTVLMAAVGLPYPDADERVRFQQGLVEELAAVPGITAVSLASHVPVLEPFGDPPMWAAERPPADSSEERTALARIVSPGYFKALGIPILTGRDFSPADRRGTPRVMVINEVMAQTLFPGENPLGKRVMVAGDPAPVDYEVVGVAGNARVGTLGRPAYLTMYTTNDQVGMRGFNLFLRSTLPPEALTRSLQKIVAARDPDLPVESLVAMDTILRDALLPRTVTAIMLTTFSAVALLLAAMGLYGVLAYHVTQRRQEIGVRRALGAGTGTVVGHVLRHSALMVVPGVAIGLAASVAASRLLNRFLYEVQPTDPVTFVMVSTGLLAVAFVASVWPAIGAARVDPVRVLRGE